MISTNNWRGMLLYVCPAYLTQSKSLPLTAVSADPTSRVCTQRAGTSAAALVQAPSGGQSSVADVPVDSLRAPGWLLSDRPRPNPQLSRLAVGPVCTHWTEHQQAAAAAAASQHRTFLLLAVLNWLAAP